MSNYSASYLSLDSLNSDRNAAKLNALREKRNAILTFSLVLYVNLWIVEGAIRKWVPGTENIFYFARDGLLLAGLLYAALVAPSKQGQALGALFWGLVLGLVVLAGVQSIGVELPPLVAAAGIRNYLAPLIPIYIVARYRPPGVWMKLSRVILIYAPVQAALTAVQVNSPSSAFINQQIGSEDAFFTTALGIVRGSGTFSAPIGLTLFSTICLAAALAGLAQPGKKGLPAIGLLSAIAVVALGGSRSAILAAAIVFGIFTLHQLVRGRFAEIGRASLVAALVASAVVVTLAAFPQVATAFGIRIETASDADNLGGRILDSAIGFFSYPIDLLGEGLGARSTVGAALGSTLGWIEDDNNRWVAELGLIGLVAAIARLAIGAWLALWTLFRLRRIPAMAATAAGALVPVILYGSITTQPTSQGFTALCTVLLISSNFERDQPAGLGLQGPPAESLKLAGRIEPR